MKSVSNLYLICKKDYEREKFKFKRIKTETEGDS